MEFQALFPTITTIKKTLFHNFFPTKTEEDVFKSIFKSAGEISHSGHRELIEIRDIHPPPAGNPNWFVKKTLNPYETTYGKVIISFSDMFDHVIRYWSIEMANYLNVGRRVGVAVWDVTEEQNPKIYYNKEVFVCMVDNGNGDFVLSCMDLFRDQGLKVDDEICLGWDYGEGCFRVRVGRV